MKQNRKNLDNLVNRILTETLQERADELTAKLKNKNEVNELGGMDDGHPRFGKKNFGSMSPEEIDDLMNSYVEPTDDSEFEDEDEENDYQGNWVYPLDEEDGDEGLCECGGNMYEGVCNECGNSYGMMDEEDVLGDEGEELFDPKDSSFEENVGGCQAVKNEIKSKGGKPDKLDLDLIKRYNCKSINESLKGGQKKLDKNKNNKIDAEDFKLLRKNKKDVKETDVEEGNAFTGELAKAKKEGKKSFEVDGKKFNVKESIRLTESELIQLIENIVNEEKLKSLGDKPKGLSAYEKSHNGSGKENKEYLESVTKKMKDYLKDGSKGEYNESPKHHPKGNGQLEKMNSKKYTMSDDGKEFLDDYMSPGMENLDYDEIHPNDDWMNDNIEGSSRTGNNPKWANAEETELGEKINKKRKANKFAKAKRMAYNKSPQPVVSDKSGDENGTGLHIKLESETKSDKILKEEFNRITELLNYNRKTQ